MKKILVYIFICMACVSCGQSENNSHLRYFGFSLINTYWDDPTDSEIKTDYIDEVAAFTNIADILVLGPRDNIVAKMQNMNNLGVKSGTSISLINRNRIL